MQIFEIRLNTKKEESVFESFYYEPKNLQELKLGSLGLVGEFSNPLPQNISLLKKITEILKEEYYSQNQDNPERSLAKALERINQHLEKETQEGNINWLGNLHLAVFAIQNLNLIFSKTGNIAIYLFRNGECLDISTNLESQNPESYPTQIFSNIAQGKVVPEDRIIILTKDLNQFLEKENLLENIFTISNEASLKKFLKENKKKLAQSKGLCFFVIVDTKLQKEGIKLKLPFSLSFKFLPFDFLKKKIVVLSLSLLFILTTGYFAFNLKPNPQEKITEKALQTAQLKISQAEIFLILQNKEKAESLLKEAQIIIDNLPQQNSAFSAKINELKETLKKDFSRLEQIK